MNGLREGSVLSLLTDNVSSEEEVQTALLSLVKGC